MKLRDLVAFRRERIFEGAVQIGWFYDNRTRAREAAVSFVFHGPSYHAVTQEDLEGTSDHRLTDTATFTRDLLQSFRRENAGENPFTLAIAGYGTGKSHLGLTLATLFSEPQGDDAERILDNLRIVEKPVADEIRHDLERSSKPYLVVAINGMEDFNLASKINELVLLRLRALGQDTAALEDLRPRFRAAEAFVRRTFTVSEKTFVASFGADITEEEIIERLRKGDERTFEIVNDIFEEANGMPINAVGQESLQEFLSAVVTNYSGPRKPFRGVLIIFDEFGRYLEFAVERPQIAGSAALQQLFEGVQGNSEQLHLVCFIQHELKAYISRVAQDRRDELNRYVGRFDSARKVYLSTNLETIFASLIEKKDSDAIQQVVQLVKAPERSLTLMRKWFPGWDNCSLWCDPPRFSKIVEEGCWPLHAVGTWFLYRLAAVGKSLQQRSAVSLLADVLDRHASDEVPSRQKWSLPAVTLCSDALLEELLSAETYGQQTATAHAFVAARDRYEHKLSLEEDQLLRGILIAGKLALRVENEEEAKRALALIAGRGAAEIDAAVARLAGEYGVVAWDERLRQYEIIGDAVPRSAFDHWLKEAARGISAEQRTQRFVLHGQAWSEHLADVRPAFAQDRMINTKEWIFQAVCSCQRTLKEDLKTAYLGWQDACDVDTPRGKVIYCYISADQDAEKIRALLQATFSKLIEVTRARMNGGTDSALDALPIFVVLLNDKSGAISEAIAELAVLELHADREDAIRFRQFIADHKIRVGKKLAADIKERILERDYVYCSAKPIDRGRLEPFGSRLFEAAYPQVVCFPFDGYQTAQGNAAKDCRDLTTALFSGIVDVDYMQSLPIQKQNRARKLLEKDGWDTMGPDGTLRPVPRHPVIGAIFRSLKQKLETEKALCLGTEVRRLCKPPLGCNLASAGLLLALFACARKQQLAFTLRDEDISPPQWVSGAFGERLLLQVDVLDQTRVRLVDQSESDAWETLLAEWDSAVRYEDKDALSRRAAELRRSLNVPAHLLDRVRLLEERTVQARRVLEDWEREWEKLEKAYESARRRQDAGELSRCGEACRKLTEKMKQEAQLWTQIQVQQVERMIEECRQAAIQCFSSWLKGRNVRELPRLGAFQHEMEVVARNLTAIGLGEQAEALKTHVKEVEAGVVRRIRSDKAADEARKFLGAHSLNQNLGVARLAEFLSQADSQIVSVDEAYGVARSDELLHLRRDLEARKAEAEDLLSAHKDRKQRLFNSVIHKPEDLTIVQEELRRLVSIFAGASDDLAEFGELQQWAQRIEEDFRRLRNLELGAEEFRQLAEDLKTRARAASTEDSKSPWDIERTYDVLRAAVVKQRAEAASEWIRETVRSNEEIGVLDARTAQRLKSSLESYPVVLSKEQIGKVDNALTACETRLDDLEVEGLLAKFENLSEPAKREFLARAETLLRAEAGGTGSRSGEKV